MIKIGIVGPQASGKSQIAEHIKLWAKEHKKKVIWVDEFEYDKNKLNFECDILIVEKQSIVK